MKRVFFGFVIFVALFFCIPVLSAQESEAVQEPAKELVADNYVQVAFNDLPVESQLLLIQVFKGYEFQAIFQHSETKLLKVVVVKEEEEITFIQQEKGNFVEQE